MESSRNQVTGFVVSSGHRPLHPRVLGGADPEDSGTSSARTGRLDLSPPVSRTQLLRTHALGILSRGMVSEGIHVTAGLQDQGCRVTPRGDPRVGTPCPRGVPTVDPVPRQGLPYSIGWTPLARGATPWGALGCLPLSVLRSDVTCRTSRLSPVWRVKSEHSRVRNFSIRGISLAEPST